MTNRKNTLSALIAFGIWVLVLQNAGVIPPITTVKAESQRVLDVNIVSSHQPLDINLHSVVGRDLVESKAGMSIGVSGADNTIIPIHWGEMTVAQ